MNQPPPEDENNGPGGLTFILVFIVIVAVGGFLAYEMEKNNELQRCFDEHHSNCGTPLPQPDAPGAPR